MLVTVFDTETTGLPASYTLDENTLDSWPSILQFSFIVYDTDNHCFREFQDIIVSLQSDGIVISEESVKIHGISQERMIKEGKPLYPYLLDFLNWCEKSDLIVGHNVEFDFKMVCAEMMRLCKNESYKTNMTLELNKFRSYDKYFCTMKSTTQLCQIYAVSKTGKQYVKFPTLTELHFQLFKQLLKNMHNAINDVLICFRCFYKLQFDEDIMEKNTTFFALLYNIVDV